MKWACQGKSKSTVIGECLLTLRQERGKESEHRGMKGGLQEEILLYYNTQILRITTIRQANTRITVFQVEKLTRGNTGMSGNRGHVGTTSDESRQKESVQRE